MNDHARPPLLEAASLAGRSDVHGIPGTQSQLQIVLHNDGAQKVPDAYGREGIHYVTLDNQGCQQVVWEIDPLAWDRVTVLEIGYWVNKMLAAPGNHVSFEIGRLELQRVDADHHTGWGPLRSPIESCCLSIGNSPPAACALRRRTGTTP